MGRSGKGILAAFKRLMDFNQTATAAREHKNELSKIFNAVIDSGIFLNGPENLRLEKKLTKLLSNGFVTTVASGHDALLISLQALELKKNDEIIFPVNSYPTAFPLAQLGAKMVPVDVDENGQIDPKEIEKKITKYTKVIVTVHLYGLVGNLKDIIKLARKHNLYLIEDAAQSFGTTYQNKFVGTLGDIGCFSFYPTKNLGTLGDGGAIWTKHKSLHKFFQQAKSYGERKRYFSLFVSRHSRIPEIQAAVLNHYLTVFLSDKKQKQHLAKLYMKYLKGLSQLRLLLSNKESEPVQHLFVVEVHKRDALRKFLTSKKIPTAIHYPYPVHLIPAFSKLEYKRGDFPMSERLSKRIVSLPFHQYLTELDIAYITSKIKEFYNA